MLDWLQPNVPLTDLRAIRCPSLIICGDHDVITIAHTLEIYTNIPRAYLWVIPNSGHGTLVEHRDLFNTVVDKFLKEPYQNRN